MLGRLEHVRRVDEVKLFFYFADDVVIKVFVVGRVKTARTTAFDCTPAPTMGDTRGF